MFLTVLSVLFYLFIFWGKVNLKSIHFNLHSQDFCLNVDDRKRPHFSPILTVLCQNNNFLEPTHVHIHSTASDRNVNQRHPINIL